jgi:arylformamidase
MKLYDISQEVFSCKCYPGDPAPQREALASMEKGELYNLTAFSMCAHNGTHLDAPRHFLQDGKAVDEIALSKTVGAAYVAVCNGELDALGARNVLAQAEAAGGDAKKRILLKGRGIVTPEAAEEFAKAQIDLLGVESQSVGDENAPMAAHLALLSREVVLLEGIRLDEVNAGAYFLCAQPLKLQGCDGAPVRAVLVDPSLA